MSKEVERPAASQASPDAPLTTEAVTESVTRICLDDEPPDIPPGETVEINLVGTGPARTYALIIALPHYSAAEKVLMSADMLSRSIDGIRQALDEKRPPEDVDHWKPLVRRLCWAEDLLDRSGFHHYPLMQTMERGRELLLGNLQDALIRDSVSFSAALSTLDSALSWCQELAEEADASVEEYREELFTVDYHPLGSQPLDVNYPTPLLRGLHMAEQLGLDMSTLEVGYGVKGAAVLGLRGRRQ
jgi:hypothetical protein